MIAAALIALNLALPQAPQPHMDRTTVSLIAADAAVRFEDVVSTHRMLQQGDHELFLPKAIANHTPAMAAYSGAVVVGNALAARFLIKHKHPRMAKALLSVDIAQDGFWATKNFTLKAVKR